MSTLLIELGVAELPTDAVEKLSAAFLKEMTLALAENNINFSNAKRYATARRLAISIDNVAEKQDDQHVEKRGPALKAAKDSESNWSKAAQGFAKSCAVSPDELIIKKTPKGDWLFFEGIERGRPTKKLIPDIFQNIMDRLPIARRMRWGDRNDSFMRPVISLVMLMDDQIIPTTFFGISSGRTTIGHRFHGGKTLEISSAKDYEKTLANSFVIADIDKRHDMIIEQVTHLVSGIGQGDSLPVIAENVLDEVNALVEYPVAILGKFDSRYLLLPQEVLIKTMQDNQKYFAVVNANDEILPYFVTVANIQSKNPEIVRLGNQKVIEPRFADAEFFWKKDKQRTLFSRREGLKKVVYQQHLGSIYDRSERIAKIAQFIAAQSGFDEAKARRGAELAKCDLISEMVFEFGELQGVIGEYYAKNDGENDDVAAAIREHYLPKFAGDSLPETDTGLVVSLADKLENIVGGFSVGAKPTGTKDPYALRRASLGVIRLLNETRLNLSLDDLLRFTATVFAEKLKSSNQFTDISAYIQERLKGYYIDQGFRQDVFEAISIVRPKHTKDYTERLKALTAFMKHESATNLFAANKRISNILKKASKVGNVDIAIFTKPQEKSIYDSAKAVEAEVNQSVATGDYEKALNALATLRMPLDDFFEHVIVMANDEKIKDNRLALLTKISNMFLCVADFSAIDTSNLGDVDFSLGLSMNTAKLT